MKKSGIITLSIIALTLALTGVLFGAVFCLRKQNVTVVGVPISISKDEIIATAGLKKGESIFMINKQKATTKIEEKYPYLKVIQIKTTNLFAIDIRVRARYETFYTEHNNNFYILDEDLKVLRILEKTADNTPQLSHIEDGVLNINETTKVSDFIGNAYQTNVIYNLFSGMNNSARKTDGTNREFLTRPEIIETIKYVDFEKFETFNKIIVTTKYGVKLDIENPTINLENKINICFSLINSWIEEENESYLSSVIKIFYDLENNMKTTYIEE